MLRTLTSTLAAGVVAVSVAACSASSNGQAGCTQPPLQQYAVPLLVTPASGSTNVPDGIGTIQISTTLNVIVGNITLVSPSGTLNAGHATLVSPQPNPNTFTWNVKIPLMKAATTYAVTQSVTYPGACLGPATVQSHTIGSFTTQ